MERWWCRKYRLPPTDPRLSRYTRDQLLVEYLGDLYEKDPTRAMMLGNTLRKPDEPLVTGDAEADAIEARLAAGEDIESVFAGWEGVRKAPTQGPPVGGSGRGGAPQGPPGPRFALHGPAEAVPGGFPGDVADVEDDFM